jgi:ribosome-associated protein
MVVASGRSNRHVAAVCDRLISELKDAGYGTPRVEGLATGDWVLIDAGDVIVHVFRPEIREFYNIEKMWQTPEIEDEKDCIDRTGLTRPSGCLDQSVKPPSPA